MIPFLQHITTAIPIGIGFAVIGADLLAYAILRTAGQLRSIIIGFSVAFIAGGLIAILRVAEFPNTPAAYALMTILLPVAVIAIVFTVRDIVRARREDRQARERAQ